MEPEVALGQHRGRLVTDYVEGIAADESAMRQVVAVLIGVDDRGRGIQQPFEPLAQVFGTNLGIFEVGNLTPDRDILVWLPSLVQKRNDCRVNPVEATQLGAVFEFPLPHPPTRNRLPHPFEISPVMLL